MTSSHWRPVNGWFSDWAWSNIFTYFDHFIHYFLLFFLKNPYYFTLYDVLVTFSWHIVFYFTRYGRSVEVKAELNPALCCYCHDRATAALATFRTPEFIKYFKKSQEYGFKLIGWAWLTRRVPWLIDQSPSNPDLRTLTDEISLGKLLIQKMLTERGR